MKSITFKNKDMYWQIAADLHFPPSFDEKTKYPAIISAHPIGSCKEQTSGNVYGANAPWRRWQMRNALRFQTPTFSSINFLELYQVS